MEEDMWCAEIYCNAQLEAKFYAGDCAGACEAAGEYIEKIGGSGPRRIYPVPPKNLSQEPKTAKGM